MLCRFITFIAFGFAVSFGGFEMIIFRWNLPNASLFRARGNLAAFCIFQNLPFKINVSGLTHLLKRLQEEHTSVCMRQAGLK